MVSNGKAYNVEADIQTDVKKAVVCLKTGSPGSPLFCKTQQKCGSTDILVNKVDEAAEDSSRMLGEGGNPKDWYKTDTAFQAALATEAKMITSMVCSSA